MPSWKLGRIHSPEALNLKEAEVIEMEGDGFIVPAGREFLCRIGVLGVPGTLDGLSHVVSDVAFRRRGRKTTTLVIPAVIFFLLTALELFLGNN